MKEDKKIPEEVKERTNILFINLKGGSAKTTCSSICASYLEDVTLVEVDKINRSDSRINGQKFYKSIQADFNNETSETFFDFEVELKLPGIKIIDVGAVKLEIFHKAMSISNLYDSIDLIIIPAMDGNDDFVVAMNYLESIKDFFPSHKIMFSFNRFNEYEYSHAEEQFDSFFLNSETINNQYGIDLSDEKNYFVLKDSKAVKRARKLGVTLRSLAEEDLKEVSSKQEKATTKDEIKDFARQKSAIIAAQVFEQNYVKPMISKILEKISNIKNK